jgi:tRNA threonylcarbamoyl adenosine modification protein YeaZ
MLTLCIDQSTTTTGLALLDGTSLLAERAWYEDRKRDQQLFAALPSFLAEAGVKASGVDLYAVGLGPGSFSGVRMAIAAACGMALPDGKPVDGVSSAAAIAADAMLEHGITNAIILGDARRERLWLAHFSLDGLDLVMARPFELLSVSDAATKLGSWRASSQPQAPAADTGGRPLLVATPDWDRIGDRLAALPLPGVTLIRQSLAPRAMTVGLLTLSKRAREHADDSTPRRPPSPIYLHPAVFVAPRFE